MAVNRELKRRIRSIKNISQVTKALQLVSAVKTRKAQLALASAESYKDMLENLFLHLLIDIGEDKVQMLMNRKILRKDDEIKSAVILISPSRGFAGSLLSNLQKKATELITNREAGNSFEQNEFLLFQEDNKKSIRDEKVHMQIITADKKGHIMALKTQKEIIAEYPHMIHPTTFENTRPIAALVMQKYQAGDIDEVFIVYTHFYNSFTQKAVIKRVLPFDFEKIYETVKLEKKENPWYTYSKNKNNIFNDLYPTYIETIIYNAIQDAVAAEHAARMIAMKNATDNANDLRKQYTLAYNQQRQAAITQEIAEITSASDAV